MKNIFTFLTVLLITASVFAQAPNKMSYQAVIRNSSDVLVANTSVGMQVSILHGSVSGTAVYVETQIPSTNANGLVSVEIGTGTSADDFAAIDWANGPYFIKTETDPAGGTNYTITGVSQLLSVPFALHSKTAESITGDITVTETDPIFTTWDKSTGISISKSQISDLQTYLTTEVDPQFATWNKATGIVITESQISDLQTYLTAETDPAFTAWDKSSGVSISESQIDDLQSYLVTEIDPEFASWDKATGIVISESQISDLQTYLTAETDPAFTAWDKSTGVSIRESQISDLRTYLTTEVDPQFAVWDKATGIVITESQISDLQTYLTAETDPSFTAWDKSTGVSISESQISDLQTYLSTEVDPQFAAWDKATGIVITESQISDLQTYLTAETDPAFTAWDKSTGVSISESQISDLRTYLTSEVDPQFAAWDKATGIVITESQISDLQTYLTSETDPAFTAWDKSTGVSISESQISDLNHFTNSDETDPDYTTSEAANITATDVTNLGNLSGVNTGDKDISGIAINQQAIQDTASQIRADIPINNNQLANGAGYLTSYTETQTLAQVTALNNSVNSQLKIVTDPTDPQDAATKAYVDLLENKLQILELKVELNAGASVAYLLTVGASVSDLLDAGVCVSDLLDAGASVSDLLAAAVSVSDLLDAGVSTTDLLDAGVSTTDFIGTYYQGGVIFYVDASNGTGLICAVSDQDGGSGIKWKNVDDYITGAKRTAIGTGQANTTDIVTRQGIGSYAAQVCDDLELNSYNDWFLPSKEELNLMYNRMATINTTATANSGSIFASAWYWSSTEYSYFNAWVQVFNDATPFRRPKFDTLRVRAIRAF